MKRKYSFIALLCMGLLFSYTAFAQIQTPPPSPTANIKQQVGLTHVEINYSRPGVKGRELFVDVESFGKIWRTGANGPTTLSFSTDVALEGKAIPAGKYALYTIPGESEWTIMIYKDLDLGGNVNDYDETKELTRFTVMSQENANMVESFTINIDDLRNNSATLQLLWGHIMVPIKMTMDTDAMIMASIEDFIENSDEEMINQFAAAANYYLNNEKDLNQALDWINTVVEARPDQFWHYQTKAKILAAKNDFKSAIEVAHQSLELAKKAPNDFGYIQSNESLIDTWTSK